MPNLTIGDARQAFMQSKTMFDLKTRMNTLVEEMSTGRKSDLVQSLGPSLDRLADIEMQIGKLDTISTILSGSSNEMTLMQTAMNNIETSRASAATLLVDISDETPVQKRGLASAAAGQVLSTLTQSLNTQLGDKSLFGGAVTDTPPLPGGNDILDAVRADLVGATDAADVRSRITAFFDTGGGFETAVYSGSLTTDRRVPLGDGDSDPVPVRADDPAFRTLFANAVLGAVAEDVGLPLTDQDRTAFLADSGVALMASAQDLAVVQGRLGQTEGRIADKQAEQAAALTSYQIMFNSMTAADPFETATALQEVQTQLETQYTLTVRLSRLSLTEYM